jgi:hypothetical protein
MHVSTVTGEYRAGYGSEVVGLSMNAEFEWGRRRVCGEMDGRGKWDIWTWCDGILGGYCTITFPALENRG